MDLPISTDQFSIRIISNLAGYILLFFHLSILVLAFQQSQLGSDVFTFLSFLPSIFITLIIGTSLIFFFQLENSFHLGLISLIFLSTIRDFRLGIMFLASALIFFFTKTFFVENIELIRLQISSVKKPTEKYNLQNYLLSLEKAKSLISVLLICFLWLLSLIFLVYTLSRGENSIPSFLFGLVSTIYFLILLSLSYERKFKLSA